MKRTFFIIATVLSLFTLTGQSALVEYDYTGRDNYSGGGSQSIVTYAGVMIFDTISSNVTFVDLRSDHTYHWSVDTNLVFTAVSLKNSIIRTIITDSEGGIDTNGYYYLNDYLITGQNVSLTISSNATYTFPRTFSGTNNRNISADTYGTYRLKTWGERMTYSSARTISDNNQGLSASNVLDNILNQLETKGTLSVH